MLLATAAGGSLAGSLIAERLEQRLGRARSLVAAFALGASIAFAPAVTAEPLVIGAAFFVSGIGVIVANVIIVSLRQQITPDRLLGRVNSANRLFGWGTRPLGAATGGLLAEILGLRPVFLLMGALMLSLLLGMRIVTDRAIAAAQRGGGRP